VVIRDIDDAPTTTYVLMAISVPRLGTARWDVIRRHAEEAIDVAEQLQDHQQLVLSLTVMAMLECFLGEYDAVLKIQDQVRDAALISKNEVHLAWSHSARGEALFRLGETARAIDELRQAEQLLEGKQHSTEEIRMAGLLAAAYWRAGDREAAIEAVHLALKRIDECSYATVSTLEAFAGVVEVMLLDWEARGTSGPLEELLPRAIAKFHWYAKVFPVGRPRWLCHRGTMHWLAGQPRKAARDWARSLREAEKMEMPLEQGFAHYEIGRHADKDSPERTKHLTLALEIFEQLGIMHELNLAKRAL
jgi:tetratricopeptide (TPR) repeat protein